MIYFDSAATTLQKPPAVAAAVARAVGTLASPGRGGHRPAMDAAETAYACRVLAGELLGVRDPERVVLTFNATHGLNIAVQTLVPPGGEVVISGWEHNAVTRPLRARNARVLVAKAPLFDREATLRAFQEQLSPQTCCVICTQVSNVFGGILPVEDIARVCKNQGIPLVVDASQGAGCLPVDADGWGAAFVAMPGHKGLYGPQGTGLLLCGKETVAAPVLFGGTGSASQAQEMPDFLPDRLEAGTHNIAGVAGLLEGLRFVRRKGPKTILAHEQALVRVLGEGLSQLPGVKCFFSPQTRDQGGVLSFLVEGMDCEELAASLGERGVAVRAGLHCAPLAHQSMGTLETGTVRASFSAFNTSREVARFLGLMEQIVRRKERNLRP